LIVGPANIVVSFGSQGRTREANHKSRKEKISRHGDLSFIPKPLGTKTRPDCLSGSELIATAGKSQAATYDFNPLGTAMWFCVMRADATTSPSS
jgi:hypothetical protein